MKFFIATILFVVFATSCDDSMDSISDYTPDIEDGRWLRRAELPTARQELQPILHENKIILIGGFNDRRQISPKVEIYDIKTDSWSTGPNYPEVYHHIAAASINGKIYAFGGFSGQSIGSWIPQDEIYSYSLGDNAWSLEGKMPEKMAEHLAVTFGDKVYILSGKDSLSNPYNKTFQFDPQSNIWQQMADMPTARTSAAVAIVNSKIFVVGGRVSKLNSTTNQNELVNVNTNEVFDPLTNSWESYSDLPYASSGLSAGNIRGDLIIVGGESISGNQVVYGSVYKYDIVMNEWEKLRSLPTSRHGTGGISYSDTLFIIGGADAPVFSATSANEALALDE